MLFSSKPASVSGAVFLVLNWAPSKQGGVTGVVRQLIDHWENTNGLKPRLMVNEWAARHPIDHADATYFHFDVVGKSDLLSVMKAVLKAPFTLFTLAHLLKKRQVVAVNFHYPGTAPLAVAILKASRLYSGRLILSYHGTDVRQAGDWLERLLRPFMLRSADAIVACSNGLATRLSETFRLPRERVSVIYNGVDSDIFHIDAPRIDAIANRLPAKFILCVGSFIPRKAHDVAVNAFARISKSFPNLHLCIAGGEGPCLEQLISQACNLGLSKRMHFFVGLNQAAVAYLLSKATLFVQTSRAESFPLSILEAASVGIPIAASRISGHDELIFEGKTGRLFADNDVADCALVMAEMLSDGIGSGAMARALHDRVLSEFTWKQCVRQYKALYVK